MRDGPFGPPKSSRRQGDNSAASSPDSSYSRDDPFDDVTSDNTSAMNDMITEIDDTTSQILDRIVAESWNKSDRTRIMVEGIGTGSKGILKARRIHKRNEETDWWTFELYNSKNNSVSGALYSDSSDIAIVK